MLRRTVERWRSGEWQVELAVAVVVAVVNAVGAFVGSPDDPGRSGAGPACVAAAAGLVLVGRRVLPLATTLLVLTLLTVVSLREHQVGTTTVALLFATHALGRWASPVRGVVGLGAMVAVFGALAVLDDPYFSQPVAVLAPGIYALPFLVGRHVARRADRLDAEREQTRVEERARVARELHDVVTHALTGISVQAGTARHLGVGGPDAATTFGRIEEMSRAATGDLRLMLALLHTDGEIPATPSPGIADLAALVTTHAATHGPVDLDVHPAVEDADPSVGLTVYRIVQESLTNVARHAHGAGSTVRVTPSSDGAGVEVSVTDDGRGEPLPGPRTHGLTGMRERAATIGGFVEAGPSTGGGFRVRASLPRRP